MNFPCFELPLLILYGSTIEGSDPAWGVEVVRHIGGSRREVRWRQVSRIEYVQARQNIGILPPWIFKCSEVLVSRLPLDEVLRMSNGEAICTGKCRGLLKDVDIQWVPICHTRARRQCCWEDWIRARSCVSYIDWPDDVYCDPDTRNL
jgi:hypothetical protein